MHNRSLALAIPSKVHPGIRLPAQGWHQVGRHITRHQPQPEVRHAGLGLARTYGALALQAELSRRCLGARGQALQAGLQVQGSGFFHGPLELGDRGLEIPQPQAGGGGSDLVGPIYRCIFQGQRIELECPGGRRWCFSIFWGTSARRICASSYLFRSTRFGGAGWQQVQAAIGRAHQIQHWRVERDARELHAALQRAHIGQPHLQAVGRKEWFALGVLHRQAAHGDRARQGHRRLRALHKAQLDVGIHHCALGFDRQVGGQVGQIRRQVQLADGECGIALAALGKRRALGFGVEAAAIEHKGQAGRDQHIALGVEAAQKRQADLQVPQGVLALCATGAVGVIHTALVQGEVVDRKFGGGAGGGVVGFVQALEDVVNVVAAVAQVGELHFGRVYRDCINHRRQPEQGLRLCIHIHPVQRELHALAVRGGHRKIAHRELQRPRRKRNAPDRDLPAQQLAQAALGLAFGQCRNRCPGQRPQS